MKTRSLAILMVLIVSWMLTGCAATPATPEAAAATALKFLQNRTARDAGAMQGQLTERARKAITATDVGRYIQNEAFRFGALGAPVVGADGWVQVPVTDYRITNAGQEVRWPEVRLTLHYEGKNWHVAWVEPLTTKARRAYENSQYGEELDLGRAITEIDPYHYRGPLEIHFAYRGLKRFRDAEAAILRAGALAAPYQAPDVEDAFARFKMTLGHPEDAIPHARAALEKAAPYTPGLYSVRWNADVLVVLARASLLRGDKAGALDAVGRAAALDPENAGVAMLRRELTP
ncbi:MAG TPA: hypothetical protein VNT01_02765 [Symbiobacteriaceae bacterium]|nr:hypothetical protein [Symbiobacteriaceae bacterium]